MMIQIEWDRTEGLKNAKGRVIGVILEPFEVVPATFEVRKAIEDAIDLMPDTMDSIHIARHDPPAIPTKPPTGKDC